VTWSAITTVFAFVEAVTRLARIESLAQLSGKMVEVSLKALGLIRLLWCAKSLSAPVVYHLSTAAANL